MLINCISTDKCCTSLFLRQVTGTQRIGFLNKYIPFLSKIVNKTYLIKNTLPTNDQVNITRHIIYYNLTSVTFNYVN